MLTRKILTSTAALAMTASVALLSGCPVSPATPTASDTPAATVAPTTAPTSAPTAVPGTAVPTAVPGTATPLPSAGATATPASPTGSSNPVGQTGGTSDIKERATFNGKVYDPDGIVVEGAKVTAKSVDPNVSWVGEEQVTTNGAYVFRNAPVGARVEITVNKDAWTTRVRTEVLKSNLQGDPTANVFDFGGLGATGQDQTSSFYAIQDEPEITVLKINGKQATNSGGFPLDGSEANNGRFGIANIEPGDDGDDTASGQLKTGEDGDGDNISVGLSGLDNDRLDVELTFSEPVDRESVQNNFEIVSQDFDERDDTNFEITENLNGITFTWASDDKSVLVKTNKPVLTTTGNPEARYLLHWTSPFKDKANNNALNIGQGNISPTGHFRYNPGTNNDFHVFSTKIDDQEPRLLSISAADGSGSNDVVRLTFSEALDVVNHKSLALALADPTDFSPNPSSDRQLWAYNTDNAQDGADDFSEDGDPDGENEATVLGYVEGDSNDNGVAEEEDFKMVYMIARLRASSAIVEDSDVETFALAQGQTVGSPAAFVDCEPARGNPVDNLGNNSLLRFTKIDGNVVTLEFAPEAFSPNERIIVAVGQDINTRYTDSTRGITRVPINVDSKQCDDETADISTRITDPAGNEITTGNKTTSGPFEVNDSLRVGQAS
jgi:hypothetical protein